MQEIFFRKRLFVDILQNRCSYKLWKILQKTPVSAGHILERHGMRAV